MPPPLVVGLGNRLRGDDGVGLEVAAALASRAPGLEVVALEGEPVALIELWNGTEEAIVVDAVAGAEPGRIHRIDASAGAADWRGQAPASSHAFGLGQVIELAAALGRLPARLEVIGIEGRSFETGTPVSAAVRAAGRRLVDILAASPGAGPGAGDSVASTREAS